MNDIAQDDHRDFSDFKLRNSTHNSFEKIERKARLLHRQMQESNANYSYHLWNLGNLRILVRSSCSGILLDERGALSKYAHLQSKLEYDLFASHEDYTISEL